MRLRLQEEGEPQKLRCCGSGANIVESYIEPYICIATVPPFFDEYSFSLSRRRTL